MFSRKHLSSAAVSSSVSLFFCLLQTLALFSNFRVRRAYRLEHCDSWASLDLSSTFEANVYSSEDTKPIAANSIQSS